MSINRNASMRPETNPAGNLLQEISEAELNQLSAGAGEPRASWGDFCTSTLECTFGTMICCPPETSVKNRCHHNRAFQNRGNPPL